MNLVFLHRLIFQGVDCIDGSFVLPFATTPLAIAVVAAQRGLYGFALAVIPVAAAAWVGVLAALLHQRLRRGPIPARLAPRYAILLSSPALIWRVLLATGNAGGPGVMVPVLFAVFAAGVLMVHARTFTASVGAPESLSLVFPLASAATAVVLWVSVAHVPGWQAVMWASVFASSVVTIVIVALHTRRADRVAAGGRARRIM